MITRQAMKRALEPGDKIKAKGIVAIIDKITFQDFYIDECSFSENDRSYIIIEFFDTNGIYRSWKSHVDGGTIIYKEGE